MARSILSRAPPRRPGPGRATAGHVHPSNAPGDIHRADYLETLETFCRDGPDRRRRDGDAVSGNGRKDMEGRPAAVEELHAGAA